MTKFLRLSIFPLLLFLFISCASSENSKVELPLKVTKSEISAWLNLMPGVSPGKFHLTGRVTLQNSGDTEIVNISLQNINVYSSQNVIYSFKPYFTIQIESDNFNLKKSEGKAFSFGIEEGLKIDSKLYEDEIISINLNFVSNEGTYFYAIDSIKVVKAY